jgi:ATP-binding cassette, subfamily B, multidrug efflux pump
VVYSSEARTTSGTHDELIARNGYYTSLFEKQRLEEELSVAT